MVAMLIVFLVTIGLFFALLGFMRLPPRGTSRWASFRSPVARRRATVNGRPSRTDEPGNRSLGHNLDRRPT